MKFKLSIIPVIVLLCACQNSDFDHPAISESEGQANSHVIPEAEAIASLKSFLNENGTRAASRSVKVKNVMPVDVSSYSTRASQSDVSKVIYVANFEKEQGFAVLAADDRIDEKVIAVADQSNVSKADVDAITNFFKNKENFVDPEYPSTGNGLFTVNDYPDEEFLNPNTFSTFDENKQDNWVGTFTDDDSTATTTTRATMSNGRFNHQMIALAYCTDYALEQTHSTGHVPNYTSDESYSNWTDITKTENLLKIYSDWDQKSPFNDYYPKKRRYLLFGCRRKAPAGCFPLALAKIMTKFRKPAVFKYNGVVVDWNSMQFARALGKTSAATLLKGVAEWCSSMYFYKGTFTFPSKASSFLKDMGFYNVKRLNYSFNRVSAMINNGCPVIIYAIPGLKIWNSHAWTIDGYKIRQRNKITRTYIDGKLISTSYKADTCKMVHCDFGWGGHCNGYYVDGVFKLNSKENEYDDVNDTKKNTKFNHHIRIITYSKPV